MELTCHTFADTTSSSEDADWNMTREALEPENIGHNVLFGGRGLKQTTQSRRGSAELNTTSSSEGVDWNKKTYIATFFIVVDTPSSSEDADWNILTLNADPIHRWNTTSSSESADWNVRDDAYRDSHEDHTFFDHTWHTSLNYRIKKIVRIRFSCLLRGSCGSIDVTYTTNNKW